MKPTVAALIFSLVMPVSLLSCDDAPVSADLNGGTGDSPDPNLLGYWEREYLYAPKPGIEPRLRTLWYVFLPDGTFCFASDNDWCISGTYSPVSEDNYWLETSSHLGDWEIKVVESEENTLWVELGVSLLEFVRISQEDYPCPCPVP